MCVQHIRREGGNQDRLSRRLPLQLRDSLSSFVKHPSCPRGRILEHDNRWHPMHCDSSRCEPRIPSPILVNPPLVLLAVNLDDQHRLVAIEIRHVRPKRLLPPKRQPPRPAPSQQLPQKHFGQRHLATQLAGAFDAPSLRSNSTPPLV